MKTASSPSIVSVHPKTIIWKIFLVMISFEIFIVFGDIFFNYYEWIPSSAMRRFFNITREDSLANWFSSMQTLLVALTIWIIFYLSIPRDKAARLFKKGRSGWLILALFFTFMSLDDGSKLHERLGTFFKESISAELFLTYGWQIVVAPFFIVIGVYMAWFLWHQLKRSRHFYLAVAALALLGFAMGLDFVEGMDIAALSSHAIEHFMKVFEEFIEMFANTIFLVVFTDVLFAKIKQAKWVFRN
jgi:hypothetical protein